MKLTWKVSSKLLVLPCLAAMMSIIPLAAKAEPPLDVKKSTCGEFVDYFNSAMAQDKASGTENDPMKSRTYEFMMWSEENITKVNGSRKGDAVGAVLVLCSQNKDAPLLKAIKMLK